MLYTETQKGLQTKEEKVLFYPSSFDILSKLEVKEHKHIDKYLFFPHLLHLQRVLNTQYEKVGSYIHVNSTLFRKYVTTKHDYKIIKFWIDAGVIEQNKNQKYKAGDYSKSYRFTYEYRNAPIKKAPIKDKKFKIKMDKLRAANNNKADMTYAAHSFLFFNLQELVIDTVPAYNAAHKAANTGKNSADKFNKYNISINALANKEYWFIRDSSGKRIHHNYAVLAKPIRKHVGLSSGEQLWNTDVVNCQPLILAALLRKQYQKAAPASIEQYINDAEQGKLYEVLSERLGMTVADEADRKVFKRKLFQVFYSKNEQALASPLFHALATVYPGVADFITRYKADNYKKLAIAMQQLESSIVIDDVIQSIAKEHYPENYFALTIHDSIVTTQDNVADVQARIKKAFSKYGISVTLNSSPIN